MSERRSDAGNARRLVVDHGSELRYVPTWGTWLVWDGRRWAKDHKGLVVERAKEVAADLWSEALGESDSDERKAGVRWALQSENAGRIRSMLELAQSADGVPVMPDELDPNPWFLNVDNGTIDLRSGLLRPHDPEHLITKLAPVTYDPAAEAQQWERFLLEVLPDDEVRTFVQRAVGYALTGSTREQVLFFAHGVGANGKNTLFDTVLESIGDYGRQADPEILLARDDVHPTGIADLQGARLVVASEIDEGRRLAEATLKRLTGDKTLKARLMRQDFFEFTATHKLFLHANHRPLIRGTDHAIWRRLRLIPFEVTIAADRRDNDLGEKLLAERAGVLRWAVQGCLAWQGHGLTEPTAVRVATAGYRAEMDVLGAFLADSCVEADFALVSAENLYRGYVRWCSDNGEYAVSQKRLGAALTERGFERRKHGPAKRWHWFGIGLVSESEGNPLDPSDPESRIDAHVCAHAGGTGTKGAMGSMGSPSAAQPSLEDSE
jgi:putative DNA primase/helicase